jgi:hypothetical protein
MRERDVGVYLLHVHWYDDSAYVHPPTCCNNLDATWWMRIGVMWKMDKQIAKKI